MILVKILLGKFDKEKFNAYQFEMEIHLERIETKIDKTKSA